MENMLKKMTITVALHHYNEDIFLKFYRLLSNSYSTSILAMVTDDFFERIETVVS